MSAAIGPLRHRAWGPSPGGARHRTIEEWTMVVPAYLHACRACGRGAAPAASTALVRCEFCGGPVGPVFGLGQLASPARLAEGAAAGRRGGRRLGRPAASTIRP
jgi:hypothetical protein